MQYLGTVVLFHTYLVGSTVFQRARSCWTSQNSAGQHNTGRSMHARKPWALRWTRSWKWSKCWNPEGSRVLRCTPGCPATKCLYTPPRFYLQEDTTFIQWLQKWTTLLKCGQSKTVFVLFMRHLWPRIWWESPSRWMGWSSYGRAVTGDRGWSCLAAVMFPRSGRRHWGPAGRETWQRRLRGPRTSGKDHTSVSRAGNTGGGMKVDWLWAFKNVSFLPFLQWSVRLQ